MHLKHIDPSVPIYFATHRSINDSTGREKNMSWQ